MYQYKQSDIQHASSWLNDKTCFARKMRGNGCRGVKTYKRGAGNQTEVECGFTLLAPAVKSPDSK